MSSPKTRGYTVDAWLDTHKPTKVRVTANIYLVVYQLSQ